MAKYEIKEFADKHTKQFRVLKDGKIAETFRGKYAERQANDYVVSNAELGEI